MSMELRPILLAEDDPDDVHFMARAFEKAGLPPPRVARDGEEAVEYLAGRGAFADRGRHPLPCLVLLDLKLPRRSGHEVLEWIKGERGLKRIPVVVLTSSKEVADINRSFDLGANSYISKPIETGGVVEIALAIKNYWLGLNRSPDLFSGT